MSFRIGFNKGDGSDKETATAASNKLRTFVNLFKQLKQWTDLISIHCSEEDMFIQCMDRSMVSLSNNRILAGWFDAYQCSGPSQVIAVRTNQLAMILAFALKDDVQVMEMGVTMEDSEHLQIVFKGPTQEQFFCLPLCNFETDIMGVPEQEYDADITISTEWFQTEFKKIEMVSETVHMECTESLVCFHGSNEELSAKIVIPMEQLHGYEVIPDQMVSGSFSTRYVNMCLNNHIAPCIMISLKKDMPMRIRYCLDIENESMISFYIAPKITEDQGSSQNQNQDQDMDE